MDERRGNPRGRTYWNGRIAFNDRTTTADCLVRNWSPTGAKIKLEDNWALPETFEVVFLSRGASRQARVVWRRGTEIGVAFAV